MSTMNLPGSIQTSEGMFHFFLVYKKEAGIYKSSFFEAGYSIDGNPNGLIKDLLLSETGETPPEAYSRLCERMKRCGLLKEGT